MRVSLLVAPPSEERRSPPAAARAALREAVTALATNAVCDVARARGRAQVAKHAGLGRESLDKALAPGAKPRFDTVLKVARALGVRLSAQPA